MWIVNRVLFSLFILANPAFAQVEKESLLIGPGDSLRIEVFSIPELEEDQARVTDSGDVPIKALGPVHVAGLTLAAAARVVEGELRTKRLVINPQVLITVRDYATEKVSVLGEVKTPGVFLITTRLPVASLIAMAGGITELADRNLIIARYGTSKKDTYFLSNTPLEDPHPVVEVQPGDTLIVPKAKIVYVLGDVRLPGGYTMTTNESRLSVLQLVARAGGTNPTAVPSHSRLIRKTDGGGYTETPLQLSEMQKGKRGDEMLRPDDVIYVPFSYFRNFLVTGASSLFSSLASAAVYRF